MVQGYLWLLVDTCESLLPKAERHIIQDWHFKVKIYLLDLLLRHLTIPFLLKIECAECLHIGIDCIVMVLLLKYFVGLLLFMSNPIDPFLIRAILQLIFYSCWVLLNSIFGGGCFPTWWCITVLIVLVLLLSWQIFHILN